MFVVMKTHTVSHHVEKVLWQVMSKFFDTRDDAELWRDFMQAEYAEEHPKGVHRFFVVETDFTHTLPPTRS